MNCSYFTSNLVTFKYQNLENYPSTFVVGKYQLARASEPVPASPYQLDLYSLLSQAS